MGKVLIFFTSNYPFGTGESFIENEIQYLSQAFDKIYLVSNNCKDEQTREVPDNVSHFRNDFKLGKIDKAISILSIANKIVIEEVVNLLKTKKLSTFVFRYLLSSFTRGKKVCSFIENLVSEKIKPSDSVYVYTYWWLDETAGACLYKNKHSETVVISRTHRYDLYFETQAGKYLPFRKFTLDTLNKLYSISQNGIDYLLNKEFVNDNNVKKIILSKLGTKEQTNGFQSQFNEHFTVVSCSYIYSNKRVELIAEALLKIKDINIIWYHIGDFSEWVDGKYRKQITFKLDKVKAQKNIQLHFMGNISNAEILNLYKTINPSLFINVSKSEGVPVSIMEAMSFSIPAIATDVGGTGEIVNAKNGYIIDVDSTPQDIADIIVEYFQLSKEEQMQKREAAYFTWNNEYNAHNNYSTFVNDFFKCLNPYEL